MFEENSQRAEKVLLAKSRLIPIDKIPKTISPILSKPPNQRLIDRIMNIPARMALVITGDDLVELGLPSFTAVRVAVPRYVRRNLIPNHFKAIQRKTDGKISIYIVNLSTEDA